MAQQVTGSKRNSDGDIAGLRQFGLVSRKSETVRNIQADSGGYFVGVGGRQVSVKARTRNGAYYLTTAADG